MTIVPPFGQVVLPFVLVLKLYTEQISTYCSLREEDRVILSFTLDTFIIGIVQNFFKSVPVFYHSLLHVINHLTACKNSTYENLDKYNEADFSYKKTHKIFQASNLPLRGT